MRFVVVLFAHPSHSQIATTKSNSIKLSLFWLIEIETKKSWFSQSYSCHKFSSCSTVCFVHLEHATHFKQWSCCPSQLHSQKCFLYQSQILLNNWCQFNITYLLPSLPVSLSSHVALTKVAQSTMAWRCSRLSPTRQNDSQIFYHCYMTNSLRSNYVIDISEAIY